MRVLRDGGAQLRCRWAVAGPGRHHTAPKAPPVWRAPEGPEGTAAAPVGGGRAWPRCRWVAAGPGRASRSTTPSAARVWRSRGRAAAHRHTQRPGPTKQPGPTAGASGTRNTSSTMLWRWGESNPRPNTAHGTIGSTTTQQMAQTRHRKPHLRGIAKGAGISRPLARVPSLIHEGHLDATHQRGDDVVEHGSQRR